LKFCFLSEIGDNPFRPEGELAREAEEFVKELKIKEEQKVNDLIQTSLNNSVNLSNNQSPNHTLDLTNVNLNTSIHEENNLNKTNNLNSTNKVLSSPSKDQVTNLSPKKPANNNNYQSVNSTNSSAKLQQGSAQPNVAAASPSKTNNNNTESPSKKKSKKEADDKVKPKCGCTIS
jgi:hypothetical protein